eukprot:GILJ01005758.1.p1 GENE.GILJ01005758.1~~GILJ01005758.1.p1  ORF type:complete len:643 (-),score=104.79 GILJ01005758.1:124-2052(-)
MSPHDKKRKAMEGGAVKRPRVDLDEAVKGLGYNGFRPCQREIVENVLQGRDSFVLMPTGGGKSLCYQLPSVVMQRVCIVVSPLIALMKDQVEQCLKRGISARLITSAESAAAVGSILTDLASQAPKTRLLYVTPEQVSTPRFKAILQDLHTRSKLGLVAIDEAHCISSWGHDFRPAYRKLAILKRIVPSVPIMALTATATHTVQSDILNQLQLNQATRFTRSFNRPNLSYEVRYKSLLSGGMYADLLTFLKSDHGQGSGIIYAQRKITCDELASRLNKDGVTTVAYHAGLKADRRSAAQEDWTVGRVRLVVATVAFGMGIDKADVRFVIHHSMAKNMEAYYQESGRAGRDGKPSTVILYYSKDDAGLVRFLIGKERSNSTVEKRKAAMEAVESMIRYCETAVCRRKQLLQYFGEDVASDLCQRTCDVCGDSVRVEAQLAMIQLQPSGSSTFGAGALLHRPENDDQIEQWGESDSNSGSEAGSENEEERANEALASVPVVLKATVAEGATVTDVWQQLEKAEARLEKKSEPASKRDRIFNRSEQKSASIPFVPSRLRTKPLQLLPVAAKLDPVNTSSTVTRPKSDGLITAAVATSLPAFQTISMNVSSVSQRPASTVSSSSSLAPVPTLPSFDDFVKGLDKTK